MKDFSECVEEKLCWKCGEPLGKNNLVLCADCNKIYSKWSKRNRGRYSIKEEREIRHAWYRGGELP